MADEVTQKHLQALQAQFNKQLADLEQSVNTKLQHVIDSSNQAFHVETDAINETIATLNATIAAVSEGFADTDNLVNQHSKLIAELQKRCD